MANEVQKSIQISYKADLKDLMAKLKQIPNVTDQEAKKMVSALDRQLKQAEKAAKKSADASKKAAKEAANAASRGAKDFDDLADSARQAEERLEHVADASGDIDRGFSSIGLALRGVNPQLATAADGLADAFAVTEGLTMSFTALNPLVLAGAAVVGGLTLAYAKYQDNIEQARIKTEEIKEEIEKLNTTIQEQTDIVNNMDKQFGGLTKRVNESSLELALMRGEITELDAATMKASATAAEFQSQTQATFNTQKDALDSSIKARKDELKITNLQIKQMEKEREIQQSLTERIAGQSPKLKAMTFEEQQLRLNQKILQENLEEDKKRLVELEGQENMIAKQSKQLESNLIAIEKIKAAEKARKPIQKDTNEGKEEEADILRNLIELDLKRFNRQQNASMELDKISDEVLLSEEEKSQQIFNKKIKQIRKLGKESKQQAAAEELINALHSERQLERLDEQGKKEEELREKRIEDAKQNLESAIELGKVLGDLSEQRINNNEIDVEQQIEKQKELAKLTNLERQAFEQDKKQQMSLFRFRQGLAIADIAMSTAEAVTAAQKLGPPFNAIQTAIAIATGAAQTAIVMGQKAPSFHMGGMAPDEMGARVLQGEAVLDRATVQRIGGEEGVQQLQQGGGMDSQVVVIQPFRHFGRFAREIGFRPQKQTGIRAY